MRTILDRAFSVEAAIACVAIVATASFALWKMSVITGSRAAMATLLGVACVAAAGELVRLARRRMVGEQQRP